MPTTRVYGICYNFEREAAATGLKLPGVKFESESKAPGSTVACNTRADL